MNNEDLLKQTMKDPKNIVDIDDEKNNNFIYNIVLVVMLASLAYLLYCKLTPQKNTNKIPNGKWSCTNSENINLNFELNNEDVVIDMNTYGINMLLSGKYQSTKVEFNEKYRKDENYSNIKNYKFYSLNVNVSQYLVSGTEQNYNGNFVVVFGADREEGQVVIGNRVYNCTSNS